MKWCYKDADILNDRKMWRETTNTRRSTYRFPPLFTQKIGRNPRNRLAHNELACKQTKDDCILDDWFQKKARHQLLLKRYNENPTIFGKRTPRYSFKAILMSKTEYSRSSLFVFRLGIQVRFCIPMRGIKWRKTA